MNQTPPVSAGHWAPVPPDPARIPIAGKVLLMIIGMFVAGVFAVAIVTGPTEATGPTGATGGHTVTYKVEGTLFRRDTREGKWTIGRGSKDNPQATVFELAATGSQNAMHLLQGNDDVLFFLDADRQPLVGNADFSYTLNRRSESPARP